MTNYSAINENLAKQAKQAMSFDNYVENSATQSYTSQIGAVYEAAEKRKAEVDPFYHEHIDNICDRYSVALADWINKQNSIIASCPSMLVAGYVPPNKKQKQVMREESHLKKYISVEDIIDKINSIGNTINSSQDNAIELLRTKVEELKNRQEYMKEENKKAKKVGQPLPFASYELSNNRQNLKSYEDRLKFLEAEKSKTPSEITNDFYTVRENVEIMRLQFIFDSKPAEEVRELLKRYGFKWSPKNKAWQRVLTNNARFATELLIKKLNEQLVK